MYKFIYEAKKEAARKIYWAVENKAGKEDPEIVDLEAIKAKGFKLVYEKDGNIYGSKTGAVSKEDELICAVEALYGEAAEVEPATLDESVVEEQVEEEAPEACEHEFVDGICVKCGALEEEASKEE